MSDTLSAIFDAAVVVLGVGGDQQLVELLQGVDLGHRDAAVAAEPAALTLHAALLMRTLNTIPEATDLPVEPFAQQPGPSRSSGWAA